jgi:hypothetical protein
MRIIMAAAVALLAVSFDMRVAGAAEWPWCLNIAGEGGSRSCGFASEAQCRASKTGNSDTCSPNPLYRPAPDEPRPRVRPLR